MPGGLWLGALAAIVATPALAAEHLVRTPAEYAVAAKRLEPGDTVVLADGVWKDFQILFAGTGEPGRPISLMAQTPGKVVLSGQSNLRLAGEYLEVSNLVFRDGWSPTGEVVSFRQSRSRRANHSRATGIVIDRYNNPDRNQSDHWVALYGQHNRFDHGQLVGKTNLGTTLVVVRDAEQGLDDRHLIDHNWFGPRPSLGSNGGETIRVGTSHDAASDSHTTVEYNWFEQCDGEVEIVSNKSGANTYRGNVFKQSRGALVLRHGDGNLVEGNVFLGDGKPHTGGIRVINRNQTVRGNHLQGLVGDGFASALSVMYGVPDSPANRYVQVDNALIEGNTFIDVRSLFFGAGMDDERSAAPARSRFNRNLIVNADGRDPLRVQGDLSGIAFAGNLQSPERSVAFPAGVEARRLQMQRGTDGLLAVEGADGAGAVGVRIIPREQVGVSWYPKRLDNPALDSGATHAVQPGDDTLTAALAASGPGDRLQLAAGEYSVDEVLEIHHPLSVLGPEHGRARLTFSRSTLFQIEPEGSLRLSRLDIDGAEAPDQAGNAVVRTRTGGNASGYTLLVEHSRISGLKVNRGFDVFAAGKGSLAARIVLRDVDVAGVSGAVLAAHAETDDRGTYNAEIVDIENSRFSGVDGPAVDLYRGGTDESTFGPELRVAGSSFANVGMRAGAAMRLHGVQRIELLDNRFAGSADVRVLRTVGEPVLVARDNRFDGGMGIRSSDFDKAVQ